MYIDIIAIIVGMLMMTGCIIWRLFHRESKECIAASITAFLIGLALVISGIIFYNIKT